MCYLSSQVSLLRWWRLQSTFAPLLLCRKHFRCGDTHTQPCPRTQLQASWAAWAGLCWPQGQVKREHWGMQWRRKVSDPLSRFFGYMVLQAVHTNLISRLIFPQMAWWASKVALPQLKLIIFRKRQQLVFVYSLTHLHAPCSVCSSSAWFAWLFSTRGWPDRSLSHMNSFLASDSHFSSSLLKHLKISPPFPGLHLGNSPSGAANPLQKWPSQVLAAEIIKSKCW